jgi:hypothetical protein
MFQFRVFDANGGEAKTLRFTTHQGKELEVKTLQVVKSLMAEMEQKVVNDAQFQSMLALVSEDPNNATVSIQQFTSTRHLIARQGVELLRCFGEQEYPFERLEVACTLYSTILNKGSFQIILNEFSSAEDRANVCHRLGIESKVRLCHCTSQPICARAVTRPAWFMPPLAPHDALVFAGPQVNTLVHPLISTNCFTIRRASWACTWSARTASWRRQSTHASRASRRRRRPRRSRRGWRKAWGLASASRCS